METVQRVAFWRNRYWIGHAVRILPGDRLRFEEGASRLLKKSSVRFDDGFVTIMVGEFNLDCAVVEQFGGSFALDLIAFFASVPAKAD
jgi:hypothetical protein